MSNENPMPSESPRPGYKWVQDADGAWYETLIGASSPPPTGKVIRVNGADTWFADPNVSYVKGSAEDPMVATERARAQRQANLEAYTNNMLSQLPHRQVVPTGPSAPQPPSPGSATSTSAPTGQATRATPPSIPGPNRISGNKNRPWARKKGTKKNKW